MKKARILLALAACAGLVALQAHASDPYHSDFSSSAVTINYVTNGGGTSGTFTATDVVGGRANAYTSGSSAPGTHGTYSATTFTGSYSLTANIQKFGSIWEVTSGTVTINGDLFNPGVAGHSTDLLLQLNLKTGPGSIVYHGSSSTLFDFFFTVSTLSGGGNSSIVADFFGAGTGQGEIDLNASGYTFMHGYTSFGASFTGNGLGSADTFVPEPALFPLAAAVTALFGTVRFAGKKRKTANLS